MTRSTGTHGREMRVPPDTVERRYAAAIVALFTCALVLRLAFVLVLHPARDFVFSDMQSYDSVALDLLGGRTDPWHAFRPVGYPMLLALVYGLTDESVTFVSVLQACMSAALVPWTAQVARASGANRVTAALAALFVAASLPLVFYCGLLLSEVSAAFFLLLGLKLLVCRPEAAPWRLRRVAWAGLALGVAGAVRPNLLFVYPALAAYLYARSRQRRPGVELATFALALLLPLLPVSAYNSHVLGRVAGPAANGGLNFYLNFADLRTIEYQGPFGGYQVTPVPNFLRHSRIEITSVPFFDDGYYYRAGLQIIRHNPNVLLAALDNFREAAGTGGQYYWPDWEGQETFFRLYSIAFFYLALVPALLFMGLLIWRARRPATRAETLLVAGVCVAGALPIYVYLGDPRVRVPFDPLWIVLAGLGFQTLGPSLRRWLMPAQGSSNPTG